MRVEVIACDGCREILGVPAFYDIPAVPPDEVFEKNDAGDGAVEREFADGWTLYAFPDPSDPIAISVSHKCPDCT